MNSRAQTINQDCSKRCNFCPVSEQKTRSDSLLLIVCAQVFLHLLFFVGIGTSYINLMGAMGMMDWSAASASNAYFDTLKLVHFSVLCFLQFCFRVLETMIGSIGHLGFFIFMIFGIS